MGNCQKEEQFFDNSGRQGPIQQIRVTNYIWSKDYQGLFDYQSKSINKTSITFSEDCILSKFNNVLSAKKQLSKSQVLKNGLFKLTKTQNYCEVTPLNIENQNQTFQKTLWLVVKSLPNQTYPLQQRDVIKLGKQKMRVRELVPSDSNIQIMNNEFDKIQVSKCVYDEDINSKPLKNEQVGNKSLLNEMQSQQNELMSVVTSNEQVCRICLDSGEKTNPLITPCKCSGSVKYIHLKCLRMWLGKRLKTIQGKHFITINWEPFACEMCKTHYKYRIYLDNKKFYTVQIPKPKKPYAVLEIIKKTQGTKLFLFVTFSQKKKINLGRRKDIDVKVCDDISVSRNHASLEYIELTKQFLLTDNSSKFGTLALIKKSLYVRPIHNGISFQAGAQVYSCQVIRNQGNTLKKDLQTNYLPEQIDEEYVNDVQDNDSYEGEQQQNEGQGQIEPVIAQI